MAKKKIAVVCTGAVGGYAGAHMVKGGEDVTFIDFWPEHVEHMKKHGLKITHLKDVEPWTVPVRALHVTEAQQLAKEDPIDIAFICTKSYDTAWAATMIKQYLAPGGYCVSLQNCMNEETIASVVGWGKTLGSIASSITVGLNEPGHVARAGGKHGSHHTVFRVGEVHGRHTDRAKEVRDLLANADSAVVTENLWGERWSKLVTNVMGNGLSACTGMITRDLVKNDVIRHFSNRLGSEAIRVGQALGYTFDEVSHMDPELIARSGEGDATAQKEIDDHRLAEANRPGGGEHRPSMGQDMVKGRRTEINFLNGFVVQRGKEVGIDAPTNATLTDIVTRVERGELKPDPKHITDLRLN
ncbi:MAG TPA: ketopantoate reductase family protein [Stellaceae bacterium]|nr:ketopantoate reductase family protein [Stellaceae bacterium]